MYSLNTLAKINARAATAPRAETETTRHCSYCASRAGVVLHSARQRSTAFISGAQARKFQAGWLSTNSTTVRDGLVESFFNSASTGKRKVAA